MENQIFLQDGFEGYVTTTADIRQKEIACVHHNLQ